MKKNELREGNYINGMGGILCVVNNIVTNEKDELYVNGVSIDDFRPISLTKEILLKNNFKTINTEPLFGIPPGETFYRILYQIDNNNCPLILKEKDKVLCHVVPSDGFYGCALNPIKYIHQLQNLYFALTGKELEAKF